MMILSLLRRELVLALVLLLGLSAVGVFAAQASSQSSARSSAQSATQSKVSLHQESPLEKFKKQMAQNISQQLAQQMNVPAQEFQIDFENLRVSPSLPAYELTSIQVLGLGSSGSKRLDGLVSFTVLIGGNENSAALTMREVQVNAVMKVIGPVPVARANLVRGRMLESNDLEWKKLPWKTFPTGSVGVAANTYVGRRVRSFVNAGDIVWSGSLEEAFAVRSGDQVTLTVFSGPGVIIRSRGFARGEGRMGEDIRIEQPDTKKIVIGKVVGEKSVEVRF